MNLTVIRSWSLELTSFISESVSNVNLKPMSLNLYPCACLLNRITWGDFPEWKRTGPAKRYTLYIRIVSNACTLHLCPTCRVDRRYMEYRIDVVEALTIYLKIYLRCCPSISGSSCVWLRFLFCCYLTLLAVWNVCRSLLHSQPSSRDVTLAPIQYSG